MCILLLRQVLQVCWRSVGAFLRLSDFFALTSEGLEAEGATQNSVIVNSIVPTSNIWIFFPWKQDNNKTARPVRNVKPAELEREHAEVLSI